MRFLLVMLAVAASNTPLVACEATRGSQTGASSSDSTNGLAPEAVQPTAARTTTAEGESSAPELKALGKAPATGTVPTPAQAHDEAGGDIAVNGNHAATAIDEGKLGEGKLGEGNGEPMDDVDDEEVPAADKSGVEHPSAADEEPEGIGIKLQE